MIHYLSTDHLSTRLNVAFFFINAVEGIREFFVGAYMDVDEMGWDGWGLSGYSTVRSIR